uniref:Uncharacterized protein n=1 Tax=Xenopus tropicalis TaxID=8364 RepID=A0A6I8RDW2_XENTR
MAEDHGLRDGYGAVDVAQSSELILAAMALDVVLLDGVQSLLLPLQLDDVGFRHNLLGKSPHRFFKSSGEEKHLAVPGQHPPISHSLLDADALILVSLSGDHHVCFIEHKHLNLLGINKPEFGAPVEHRSRRADNNMLWNLLPALHSILTFLSSHSVGQFDIGELPHLFNNLPKAQALIKEEATSQKLPWKGITSPNAI